MFSLDTIKTPKSNLSQAYEILALFLCLLGGKVSDFVKISE